MTDRPALVEIRVTPEMIEAGLAAWSEYDERFESLSEMIVRVYLPGEVKSLS